jgi:hypothetical protein
MRLTVGPLAPAVYWRRRAVVATIVALAVVSVMFAIKAMSNDDSRSRQSASTPAQGAQAASKTSTSPAVSPARSETSPPGGPVESKPENEATDPSSSPGVPVPLTGGDHVRTCTDENLALTAVADPNPGRLGGTFYLSLTIRNVSAGECSRDIGSGPQEMRVLRENSVIWSSNDCGAPAESDVRTFPAGVGVRFTVQWNSYRVAPDTCRRAATPAPEGTYQVVARLGEKVSEPVAFEIVR